MADCTYRMKDAAGAWQTITGKPAMMAALAEGRLDHLFPGGMMAGVQAEGAAAQAQQDAEPAGALLQNRNAGDADPDEARRVQVAIEGKGLIDAARFMTQSADKAKAAVAEAVLDKLQRLEAAGVNLELHIAHRGDMVPEALHNGRGFTETGFDDKGRDIVVWLNGADVAGKVGTDEETILHELVHAATTGMVYYGQKNPSTPAGQHVRDLMAVTDAIAAHISQRFEDADAGRVTLTEFELDMREGANNAFRSDDEVLAWALSSREAQTYLEGIPYRSGGSMWSRFVSAVRSLLGLTPQQDTALSEVLAVAERLMTDDAPMAGRAAFWHKRGMRMVQQQGRGSIVQSRQAGKEEGPAPAFSRSRSAAVALSDVERRWSEAGIKHSISERDGIITVHRIVVPDEQRGKGGGTAAMRALVEYADQTGQHIALTPSSDFGGNKKRLAEFYKRFGFKENKGKGRAFSVSESMVRENPDGRPLYSFAGPTSQGADKFALSSAQQRIEGGEDAEAVRQETGWFKGPDGKWRYEISDADAKLLPALRSLRGGGHKAKPIASVTYRKRDDGTFDVTLTPLNPKDLKDFVTLEAISESAARTVLPDEVFAAVERGDGDEDVIGYLEEAKRITAPFQFDGFDALPLDQALDHPALFAAYPALRDVLVQVDPKLGIGGSFAYVDHKDGTTSKVIRVGLGQQLSTLLHEIQHGIQDVEGFASGGTPQQMNAEYERLRDIARLRIARLKAIKAGEYKGDEQETEAAVKEAIASMQQIEGGKGLDAYRRLAGEVEARNTQARHRMTDAERRATPPSQTADVPDADVILVFNGKEMANAPMPENAEQPAAAPGITYDTLPDAFAKRFPKLAGAVKTMLHRGALGQKGGLVVLDSNDSADIAREFASRTGWDYRETVEMFESVDGAGVHGIYDPKTGTIFAVGPNLDEASLPAVILHEAIHGQQRASVDTKAQALLEGRAKEAPALRAFLDRVAVRMEEVGETGNRFEAAPYIVEMAVTEGRKAGFSAADGPILAWIEKNIGRRVADLVRDFVATLRAWALAHGVPLKSVAVDDLVAYAMAGVGRAARGEVVTLGKAVASKGGTYGKIGGMDDANNVAGKQAPTQAGDVETGAQKPDFNAAAQQILDAIEDDGYDYGLRVIPGEYEGDIAAGDSLPNSYVWSDGNITDEQLEGVSAAEILSADIRSVLDAIKNIGAHGKPGPNGYYFGDRVVLVRGEKVEDGEDVGESVIADPEVVGVWHKPTMGNSELIPNESPASASSDASPKFSRSAPLRAATKAATSALNKFSPSGQAALGTLTADQQAAVERVFGKPKTLAERAEAFAKDWKKNLVQGVFDQFAPIKEISSKGYMLARLAKGGDSTLEAMLMYGKVSVDGDGAYQVDFDGQNLKGFASTMAKLDGEHDRFLAWVSGQRAERLAGVGLENLMTAQDITALKTLADGSTASGKVRRALYAEALKELNAFNDSVLKIAADSGLIDEATRAMYRDTPYVPFYRLSEEEVVKGPAISKGLVNQSAWKQLKGGTDKLNEDLMGNLLKNWSHLITASANNRAAKEVLDTAARMGAATDMTNDVIAQDINGQPIYRGNTKGLVRYRGEIKRKIPAGQPYIENGKTLISDGTAEIAYVGDRYFRVDDPHLMDAIASIGFTTKVWKPMADFKRYLTFGVTVNPTFKIRNLIRDSIQAVGTADLSYNPVKNILMGAKGTEMMSNVRAQMLASGGMLRFGSSEGAYSGHVRRLIEKGVDPQYILDNDSKVKAFWKHKVLPAFEAYQELGDRSENVNRAALYEQLLAKGMSHAEASFWARDMMDFSMHGKWAAIRTLTAVVPFMNARLQGIYKLGRATKADYRRMGATLAAVSLASMALMLAYGDDDDWKKREDWDRDNSWWFKIGDTAFRIPKPFEVGAVGTIAERSLELMISDEMTGKRFGQRMRDLLMHNLSMNPTPQLVKPMIDLYANKDGFSGRDIETQGMEKMRPEDRYTARTSEVARFLGQLGLPNPAQLLMGRVEGLSPVQIDHLIRGYFSWVGTSATNVLDRGIRPMMDRGEQPDMRLRDVFLAGNFVETLPSGSSRYVTQFYEQAKEIEQMYASYRQALKEGDAEKAQEIRDENPEGFAARRRIEAAKRAESLISGQMRTIERDRAMTGEEKRARLDQLEKRRDEIARRALLVPAAAGRD